MTMNNFVAAAFRDLTCVLAAAVITLVVGMAFVQSTNAAPVAPSATVAHLTSPAPLYT
jgi:hypothetical protein